MMLTCTISIATTNVYCGSTDVFVHISAVEKAGCTNLVEGARISYELGDGIAQRASGEPEHQAIGSRLAYRLSIGKAVFGVDLGELQRCKRARQGGASAIVFPGPRCGMDYGRGLAKLAVPDWSGQPRD